MGIRVAGNGFLFPFIRKTFFPLPLAVPLFQPFFFKPDPSSFSLLGDAPFLLNFHQAFIHFFFLSVLLSATLRHRLSQRRFSFSHPVGNLSTV